MNPLIKVAEAINRKRRSELISLYTNNDHFQRYLKQIRSSGVYNKGSKSKVWRKVASMPIEIDEFFSNIYGVDYYKDKNFFKDHAPEWLVITDV